MNLILLSILFCFELSSLLAADQKVVCYWPNWALHEKAPYRNTPEDIDASLCTHLHYSFAILDEAHETPMDSSGSPQVELYKRIEALKQKNKNLKVILSLGGWGDDGGKYSRISASSEKRKTFIANSIQYLHKYGFDGLGESQTLYWVRFHLRPKKKLKILN
jgi:chitinase